MTSITGVAKATASHAPSLLLFFLPLGLVTLGILAAPSSAQSQRSGGIFRPQTEEEADRDNEPDSIDRGPGARACMAAIEARVADDPSIGARARVLFESARVASTSTLYETIEGRARVSDRDERAIEYSCRVSRLSDRVSSSEFRFVEAGGSGAGASGARGTTMTAPPLEVRCESQSLNYQRCPIARDSTATLVERLSRAECRLGWSWGQDEDAVWVDRGCRAVFNVFTPVARVVTERLIESVEGWGILRSLEGSSSDGALLSGVEIELLAGGAAELSFRGADTLVFAGSWFGTDAGRQDGDREKIELVLERLVTAGGSEDDRDSAFEGAGSLYLREGRIAWLQLAGQSQRRERFALLFSAEGPPGEFRTSIPGTGRLVLPDRTVSFDGATITLGRDGRAELSLRGQVALTIRGRWFAGWSGRIELSIERLGNASATGGGTVLLTDDAPSRIEISGRSVNGTDTYHLAFEASERSRSIDP